MKKFFGNASQLTKLVLSCLAIGIFIMMLSCIGIIFGQFGWLIGAAIGTLVSLFNVVLLVKGSGFVLQSNKSSFFLMFYFLRMLLYVGMTVLCAVLDFKLKIEAFHFSVFGLLIAYLPMVVVICVVMAKEKNKEINSGTTK